MQHSGSEREGRGGPKGQYGIYCCRLESAGAPRFSSRDTFGENISALISDGLYLVGLTEFGNYVKGIDLCTPVYWSL